MIRLAPPPFNRGLQRRNVFGWIEVASLFAASHFAREKDAAHVRARSLKARHKGIGIIILARPNDYIPLFGVAPVRPTTTRRHCSSHFHGEGGFPGSWLARCSAVSRRRASLSKTMKSALA